MTTRIDGNRNAVNAVRTRSAVTDRGDTTIGSEEGHRSAGKWINMILKD